MEAAAALRVLLVDDHALVRDALKRLIDDEADLLVVGEAGSEAEAVALAASVPADIALVDVSMPGSGGVKLTEVLVSTCPRIKVIGLTRHTDHAFVSRMLDAGACGYVLKQSLSKELLRAIRAVAGGERFIDPALNVEPGGEPNAARPMPAHSTALLTAVEENVLRLVAAAYSNQEIAQRLRIAAGDIATIKSSAMRKAGLLTRLEVIAYAHSRGWG